MTVGAQPGGKWLRYFAPRDISRRLQLFCFHYAGGSASMFRDWPRLLPAGIEPIAIQLPGRENRLAEPPHDRMAPLVAELVDVLEPLLGQPFACYGSSMGARVALVLAHVLRERGLPAPGKLFVASSSAPSLRIPVRGWAEPDERLVAYLRDLGGTSQEVFDNSELLALLLPIVRADLTVIGTCPVLDRSPLATPIRAFAGAADTEASPARMLAWRHETDAGFDLDVIPGGHFFTPDGMRKVLELTAKDLVGIVA